MLQDSRAAIEASVASNTEVIRKNVIYAMHVLRYGGGRDAGDYGFGIGSSSYLGLGNSLTGIDALDHFRLPNEQHPEYTKLGLAQTKQNKEDGHHKKLTDSLGDLK